jgi:hypothetical protein
MTQELFRSRDAFLSGRIPAGWFSSTEDSLAPALTAWLVKDDYSATLAIKELRLDRMSEERVRHDGLKLLANLNAALERHRSQMREIREYRIDGRSYCGYEYDAAEAPGRVVVFSAREKYYACTARREKGNWSKEEYTALFRAQQAMLSSLMY